MGKRSENTYTKINTIFKRDIKNCIMPYDGFVSPEYEWLRNCKFDAEEKIDGCNIRIEVAYEHIIENDDVLYGNFIGIRWYVKHRGKTDNAQIPPKLEEYLKVTFPESVVLPALGLKKEMFFEEDKDMFIEKKWWAEDNNGKGYINVDAIPIMYTIYGEGYGAGIQSGGYYRKTPAFIGFDVKVNDMYLLRENRNDIFNKLGADIVPYIGQFTIDEAIEFVKKGFNSRIAEEEHLAEGLVLRSPYGLCDRRGNRIIFKVKTCDWNKYYAVYKTYDKVDQIINDKANY